MIQLSTNKGYFTTINCGFNKEYNPLMEYLNYAKRLKELQSDKGIKTQIELSAWTGFSKSIISAWMRGEKIPSMDTALKIAEMFDVRVEWLLTGKGSKRITDAPQLQNYINVSNLTSDQRALINQMINQFAPKSSENNPNKPLTARPENVGGGGGVNLPDPLALYHRRQGDEPADKEFIEAVQQDYEDSK
jgi:transcriptional regulator with XRE-family HTH domain